MGIQGTVCKVWIKARTFLNSLPKDINVNLAIKLKKNFKKKTNFMAPFYGWGSTASRLEPLQGVSLLFTTKFPEIPGTLKTSLLGLKAKMVLRYQIGSSFAIF